MKLEILFPGPLGKVWKTNWKRWTQRLLKHVHEIMLSMSQKQQQLYEKHKSVKLRANTGT